jgi:uncharacterized protein YgbK (DUF1537 family)
MTDRPNELLLAWYGDDVTGSTDALEALGAGGVPAVLFLAAPSVERLARFRGCRAVGVAGVARSLPTPEIGAEVEPILGALATLEPGLVHYKICSTFDSSPDVGSIGAAIDVAWPIFRPDWVGVLVAAPALGRYTVFATHFATFRDEVYRLDRHPVMSRHPVTPMTEPDLRRHLGGQTDRAVGLVDVRALLLGESEARRALDRELADGRRIVVLDGVDPATVATAAGLAWSRRPGGRSGFVVGSSGVESGLLDTWRTEGTIEEVARAATVRASTVPAGRGPIVVASGSASAWTATQIARAVDAGWTEVPLDTQGIVRDPGASIARALEAARGAVAAGRNVAVHAARGPDDSRIDATRAAAASAGLDERALSRRIGGVLGEILRPLVRGAGVTRALVAGGDSSSWAARALGVEALEYVASLDPGVPLCRATGVADAREFELVLKGGQLGSEDLFVRLAP